MSYDDFIRLLKEQGYQIKGDDLHAESPKYISFLPPGKDRWVRGRAATLGADYTRKRINERIHEKDHKLTDKWTSEKNPELIVLSEETLADKPYLKKWADRKNLQIASEIYTHIKQAGYSSLEDALAHLSDAKTHSKSAHSEAVELDKKMRTLSKIIRYMEQYQANLPYKHRYEKAKDPEAYFRKHEMEISLCDGAAYMLKKEGIVPDRVNLETLKSSYIEMNEKKQNTMKEYNSLSKDIQELEKLTYSLERYLERKGHTPTLNANNNTIS